MSRLAMLLTAALAAGLAPGASATGAPEDRPADGAGEGTVERVPVLVTAAAAGSVYLDRGRSAGIEPGDTVRLHSLGGGTVVATVRAVSRTSARAEIEGDAGEIEIGTEGEVLVPSARRRPPAGEEEEKKPGGGDAGGAADSAPGGPDDEAARVAPPHPAWEHPPVAWEEDLPLLAPILGRRPEERDRRVRGRVHTQLDLTRDQGYGGRDYLLSRSGLDLVLENPFHRADEIDLDVELFHRTAEDDDTDEEETHFRVDRASYRWGGVRGHAERGEAGRFLQHEFPEFGVLDGVEYAHRFPSGSRIGASLGYLPSRDDAQTTGDDLQAAVFYRYVRDEEESLSLGTGFQKTWHEGKADRDLLVGEVAWHPSRRFFAQATAWIDYYTGADRAKSSGFELTQLVVNGMYRTESGSSLGLFATHLRWPEMLRNEFDALTAAELADNEVSRVGLRGTRRLSDRTRLEGRVEGWSDQDDSGSAASALLGLRDVLYAGGEVSLGVHQTSGKYTSGVGVRLRADRRFERGILALAWESTAYQQDGITGENEDLLHHVLRADYDLGLGRTWDLSLFLEDRLGDGQDSLAVGFFLQKRL
ncbi:MAG: hypothetical protein AB1726_10205 [Planctomycetota bacterium]